MDNRDNLLQQAMGLFALRGYDGVGVQEIVEAAGITKPTLYHYFGSKAGLLETLLAEQFAGLFGNLQNAADYHGDLTNTLHQVASVYFQYAHANRLFYRMQLGMYFAPPDSEASQAIALHNQRQQEILESMFARAVEDHGNMRGRQRDYAATFLGMVNTYIGLALNGHVKLDERLVNRAVHQFMHGIFS